MNPNEILLATRSRRLSVEDLLTAIHVDEPGMWENGVGPKEWYAVTHEDYGIFAYFANEVDALHFRLDFINRILNP